MELTKDKIVHSNTVLACNVLCVIPEELADLEDRNLAGHPCLSHAIIRVGALRIEVELVAVIPLDQRLPLQLRSGRVKLT